MTPSSSYHETKCACFWDYLVSITRLWGVATAVVLTGVGVDLSYHGHTIGTYVLLASILVFFLEITWAILLFHQVCTRQDDGSGGTLRGGRLAECSRASIMWCSSPSKKCVLYALIGAVILLWPQHRLWLSPIAGVMLLMLAALYVLLTFQSRRESRDTLLRGRDESFDRFDEVSEMLDDTLPEPIERRPTPHPNALEAQLTPKFVRSASESPRSPRIVRDEPDPEREQQVSGGRNLPERRTHALVDGFGDQEIILQI